MLTDKNTEILDTEEKYRSGLAEDSSWVHPSKKYKEATKPGIVIPPEMKIKHYEEINKDADALQIRDQWTETAVFRPANRIREQEVVRWSADPYFRS